MIDVTLVLYLACLQALSGYMIENFQFQLFQMIAGTDYVPENKNEKKKKRCSKD